MLVKIGNSIFPIDFVILDMVKGSKILIIIKRSFLLTIRASINLESNELRLKFIYEKTIIKVYEGLYQCDENIECYNIDVLQKKCVTNSMNSKFGEHP